MSNKEGSSHLERLTSPQIGKAVFRLQSDIIGSLATNPHCSPSLLKSFQGLEYTNNDYTNLVIEVGNIEIDFGKGIETDFSIENGLYFATRVLIVEGNPIRKLPNANEGFTLYSLADYVGVPGAPRPSSFFRGTLLFSSESSPTIKLDKNNLNPDAISETKKRLPLILGVEPEVNPTEDPFGHLYDEPHPAPMQSRIVYKPNLKGFFPEEK